jgi:phosphatidylserine/phosphatidylglycerophosphate/cardiolipin synthase-like enzyme
VSAQRLTAFEKQIVAGLSSHAPVAATLFDAWATLSDTSVQTARSLIDLAQLGVTEERAVKRVLDKSVDLGLLDAVPYGFRAREDAGSKFKRIAFALNVVEYYVSTVHKDLTTVGVVLTTPSRPNALEEKLSEFGWRTSELEATNHAFAKMVSGAHKRVIIMTPFLDVAGAQWLTELFSSVRAGVQCILILRLRTLEDSRRKDYPIGYDMISSWLKDKCINVFNYSIPKFANTGRETFHAKVILCDHDTAYVGSSNMTVASMDYSMEMGVTIRGRAAGDVAVVLEAVLKAATKWI